VYAINESFDATIKNVSADIDEVAETITIFQIRVKVAYFLSLLARFVISGAKASILK
jgi:hypothetical protein